MIWFNKFGHPNARDSKRYRLNSQTMEGLRACARERFKLQIEKTTWNNYNENYKHKLQNWTIKIHTDREHCLNERKKKHEEKLVNQRKRSSISIRFHIGPHALRPSRLSIATENSAATKRKEKWQLITMLSSVKIHIYFGEWTSNFVIWKFSSVFFLIRCVHSVLHAHI